MNPPILPWHKEAADYATAAYDRLREDKGCRIIDDIAAIISRHDPHAAQQEATVSTNTQAYRAWVDEASITGKYSCRLAFDAGVAHARSQHAETVELLQAAAFEVHNIPLATQIRAHLAALRREGGAT